MAYLGPSRNAVIGEGVDSNPRPYIKSESESSPVTTIPDPDPIPSIIPLPDDNDHGYNLTHLEYRILQTLLTRPLGEGIPSVAKRAHTSVLCIKRALSNPVFSAALQREVELDLGSHRPIVAAELLRIATTPSHPRQLQAIETYFQRLDGLKIDVNVTGPSDRFPWHVLSIETRRRVLEELEIAAAAGKTDTGLIRTLSSSYEDGVHTDNIIDAELSK